MPLIEAHHVSKVYPTRRGARALLGRGGLGDWLRQRRTSTFEALHGIDLEIEAGESIGIIGRNGSGKSTLLKLLAGVTLPSSGEIRVHGRVASLLELGAGFHPILTGRENIFLNAGLLGMRHAQTREVLEQIIDFSGIREFIDQPVDTYSSGMYVRIGFAVAVHVNPDIFLVDEVLAVGDEEFQRKCRVKIGELKERGKTIVFVSHDLGSVNALCDRVFLLDKGRLISRGTPQATIDYYLRQIGLERGIHTLKQGDSEAIFSQGRISLFQGGREVTAPQGVLMQFQHLGQNHVSTAGDWHITDRAEDRCLAQADLPRLPIRLHWEMRLEAGRLTSTLAIECLRPIEVDLASLILSLPGLYTSWHYSGRSGELPPIQPGHLEYSSVVPPEPGCREVLLQAGEAGGLPPFHFSFEGENPFLALGVENSDYMTGVRVLHLHARYPRASQPLAEGRHAFASVAMDFGWGPLELSSWLDGEQSRRTVRSGRLSARFSGGGIELLCEGAPLTATVHLHTQMRMANLWSLSQTLVWGQIQRHDDGLQLAGESPRYPLAQYWELAPGKDGIEFRVYLEAREALDVQEYNVSIGLDPGYSEWATEHERGKFPEFDPQQQDWRHLNRNYAPGTLAQAAGAGLPAISLRTLSGSPVCRMTAINTGYGMQTRVLQAIHAPERDAGFHYSVGRHLLFSGVISLEVEISQESHA